MEPFEKEINFINKVTEKIKRLLEQNTEITNGFEIDFDCYSIGRITVSENYSSLEYKIKIKLMDRVYITNIGRDQEVYYNAAQKLWLWVQEMYYKQEAEKKKEIEKNVLEYLNS